MNSTHRVRFSVDTGGTFTDIVVLDEDAGTFRIEKAPTTPSNVLEGLMAAIDKAEVDLPRVGRFFVHGSTTALNALLERKGVRTAYLATRGFRDVPQIGRLNRPQMYNPKYHKPEPLVARDLRFDITERMSARGEVIAPLDEAAVARIAEELIRRDVRAVAVCFLHAYKNPRHELRAKELLQQLAPHISVTISSQVAPEQREYERSATTILNAYLSPVVERSISELERTLRARDFRSDIVLTRSDGGGMSADVAKVAAINTLLSGPAGGVIGGVYIAALTGCENLITADVGGTSFDVGIIKNGQATAHQELTAAGFPVLIPNLDIRTIGAGCGSIAWRDSAGALHVGPQSAGAHPGPLCYGRGGTDPTVTDAALINGYIDPGYFLGGEMRVDLQLAQVGLADKIARPLGLDVPTAATGILKIVSSHMVGAVRDILAESGDDPRDFSLLCYGGGGPLFAAVLLDELQLRSAIVPRVAANFSAWGMLMIDLRHDVVAAVGQPLANLPPADLRACFAMLEQQASALLERDGIEAAKRTLVYSLDLRYIGQGHTVSVAFDPSVPDERLVDAVYERFQLAYGSLYGYTMNLAADVVSARIKAIGEIPKPSIRPLQRAQGEPLLKSRRRVTDMLDGKAAEYSVFERSALLAGHRIAGPAIIEEATAVTPIRVGQTCSVDPYGNLVIARE